MTHEQIVAFNHMIGPGDELKEETITFSLPELIILQGIVIARIASEWENKDRAFLPHRELAEKLEKHIKSLQSPSKED